MRLKKKTEDSELMSQIRWLMFFRVIFGIILLISTFYFILWKNLYLHNNSLNFLYGITCLMLFFSSVCLFIFNKVKNQFMFACIQLVADTVIISLIIYITGGYFSIFSFLYLLVIICSSMLLRGRWSLFLAGICCLEYGIIIGVQYKRFLGDFISISSVFNLYEVDIKLIIYKFVSVVFACITVAFLSTLLAEKEKNAKIQIKALEDHVKRVEKLSATGEMAAGLAHEIKNPLASLSGAIQLLADEIKNDYNKVKLTQIIKRESDRLNSLVNNFLLFAKPKTCEIKKIYLAEKIDEIIDLLKKDTTLNSRIKFSTEYEDNIWIEMNPDHLTQILWNILLNAAESIENRGEIKIILSVFSKKNVTVEIIDNGCGIPQENISSIFNPFFSSKQTGSGLGLSIVHRILNFYDSKIMVYNNSIGGTVFKFTLKRVKSGQPSQPISYAKNLKQDSETVLVQ